jgi:hypothetical protein
VCVCVYVSVWCLVDRSELGTNQRSTYWVCVCVWCGGWQMRYVERGGVLMGVCKRMCLCMSVWCFGVMCRRR